jgi:hypothetical protein
MRLGRLGSYSVTPAAPSVIAPTSELGRVRPSRSSQCPPQFLRTAGDHQGDGAAAHRHRHGDAFLRPGENNSRAGQQPLSRESEFHPNFGAATTQGAVTTVWARSISQESGRPSHIKGALPGPMGHLGDKADLTPSPLRVSGSHRGGLTGETNDVVRCYGFALTEQASVTLLMPRRNHCSPGKGWEWS